MAKVVYILLLAITSSAQVNPQTLRQAADLRGKKAGMLIQPSFWQQDTQYAAIMGTEYSAAVTVHNMQQTSQGVFDFTFMDKAMSFATAHNMKLFGGSLIYRNNASPAWLNFNTANCGGWTKAQIDSIIKAQVQTPILHGGTTYYTWSVVNEPLSPGGNGCWSTLMGGQDQMIAAATAYAAQVTTLPLMLNDAYGRDGTSKTMVDNMIALVKRVRALGGKVDALGVESHLRAQLLQPDYISQLDYFLQQAAANGLQTQITELDVYQGAPGEVLVPYSNQKQIYHDVVLQCEVDPNCTSVITWGMTDKFTWLNAELPQAKPLPFDINYAKKPAYYGELSALTPDFAAYQQSCLLTGKTPMDQATWSSYNFPQVCYVNTSTTASFTGQQEWQ